MDEPKVLAKSQPNRVAALSVLTQLPFYDLIPPAERQAFVDRGEIRDTPYGRLMLATFGLSPSGGA